jgi:hypothetical protein
MAHEGERRGHRHLVHGAVLLTELDPTEATVELDIDFVNLIRRVIPIRLAVTFKFQFRVERNFQAIV